MLQEKIQPHFINFCTSVTQNILYFKLILLSDCILWFLLKFEPLFYSWQKLCENWTGRVGIEDSGQKSLIINCLCKKNWEFFYQSLGVYRYKSLCFESYICFSKPYISRVIRDGQISKVRENEKRDWFIYDLCSALMFSLFWNFLATP